MCAKISAAIGSAANKSGVIDARGFTGNQYCSAANATLMLFGGATTYSAVPDLLLLGNVTMVIDGPTNGLWYTDGVGSTFGTPAILVPSQFSIYGVSYNGITITPCTGNGTPLAACTHAFPQRSLGTVSSTSLAGTTLTVNETGVTLTANTNVWVGERVQLVGLGTANNNVLRVVQTVPSSSSITISMPTTTTNCAATCNGTIYAFTPILGFAPGPTGGPYIPLQSGSGIQGFGQQIKHISINEQGNQADASAFTGYGVSGIQNVNGGDQSGLEDVEIHFNTGIGFDLGPGSTDAFYLNLRTTNFADNHAVPSTTSMFHAAADRGVVGYAFIGSATQTPNACIMIDGIKAAFVGTTDFINGHAEACVDDIEIGANTAARNVKVDTFLGSPSGAHNSTNVIHFLTAGTNCQGCVLTNITRQSSGATSTIVDDVNGITCTDLAISSYHTDVGGNAIHSCTTGTLTANTQVTGSQVSAPLYKSTTACHAVGSAASPSVALCGPSPAGVFSCAVAGSGLCTVNTTAVISANSTILLTQDTSTLTGTLLGVTCNTTVSTVSPSTITAKVAATSFSFSITTPVTNPDCFQYSIIN